jgi:hypothetical protein
MGISLDHPEFRKSVKKFAAILAYVEFALDNTAKLGVAL